MALPTSYSLKSTTIIIGLRRHGPVQRSRCSEIALLRRDGLGGWAERAERVERDESGKGVTVARSSALSCRAGRSSPRSGAAIFQ